MSAITRATWGERVIGGDPEWIACSGWRTECDYCGDVFLHERRTAVAGYARTHATYCPDAPTPTEDTTA